MNYKLHNLDLQLLQQQGSKPRFGKTPGWKTVDWKPTPSGGNMIYLRQVLLPPNCSVERTDIKIEAPPNLYDPTGDRLIFYRNLWISPNIKLYNHKKRQLVSMPRLHGKDSDGFAYLCLHPDPVSQGTNILDFLRVMDLFLLNPGYKASSGEAL